MGTQHSGMVGGNGTFPSQDHRPQLPGCSEQPGKTGRIDAVLFEQMLQPFIAPIGNQQLLVARNREGILFE